MVGYDLTSKEDYTPLIDRLKKFGTFWHHLDSTWLLRTDMTHTAVRDELLKYMYGDDRLLVAVITAPAAWSGFYGEGHRMA